MGSKSLRLLLRKQCTGSARGLFSASGAHSISSLVNASFSLVWEAEVLWRLQPWPLMSFFFGLKLLDQLALVTLWRRVSLIPIWLWLGVDRPLSFLTFPLSWWLLLFSLPDSVSHLNSLYKLSRECSLWFQAKEANYHHRWLLPLSAWAGRWEEERVSPFWSLVSGTWIFRKTRDLLHWIM